jgi:hypothetical protein
MRYCYLLILYLLLFGCAKEDYSPDFEITEELYKNGDLARARFDQIENKYILTFFKLDESGQLELSGPFDFKVMDQTFTEIRNGEVGSTKYSGDDAWHIPVVPLNDTILFGDYYKLKDDVIMGKSGKFVNFFNSDLTSLHAIELPYGFRSFTETDNLLAFTFEFSLRVPSDEDIICVTYNKNTHVMVKYLYQFDSGLEEQFANKRGGFSITHNLDQELILATTKGAYRLVDGNWVGFLNEHLSGTSGVVTNLIVDSKNRLYAAIGNKAHIYDLNSESLITSISAQSFVLGVHPDGDYILFNRPSLFKLRVN